MSEGQGREGNGGAVKRRPRMVTIRRGRRTATYDPATTDPKEIELIIRDLETDS